MSSFEKKSASHATGFTRRAAIKNGIAGILACAVAPQFLRAATAGETAPNNRINLGLIGNGLICGSHFSALVGRDDCRIVAACDVRKSKAIAMAERVEKSYGSPGSVSVYQYHEQLLARDDIDAVFICTPDHWHVAIALAAIRAGKDVYCEKPLTLTVREGRTLVTTARQYGRILQTGTQQRSEAAFRKAAEIVRNGLIGNLKLIRTHLGEFAAPQNLPEQPIPDDFDYDRWLGPTQWRPYNEKRVLGDFGGGWRCFYEYGGRKNGDWGAHHFDIIQWAMGMDASGPVEFIPKGYHGTPYQTHVYANGVKVERFEGKLKSMIEFTGSKGTVWVSRNDYLETDPISLAKRPLRPDEIHLYVSDNHHSDFFDSVRTRQKPIADVEIGHRSATVGHLNNIAAKLNRPIRWNPATEEIIGDEIASTMLDRPRRAPYGTL
ncbi:MAG TPA: Gfo/Idh/MocA family oxidoreductase [Opitutaceae bacterium]|nr:Gfo/Idh/MocA family oxidoreductase [Opitutaceae bacterium]